MKFNVSLIVFLLFHAALFAQDGEDFSVVPSKESQAYRKYKAKLSIPPYSIAKVRAKVSKIKNDSESLMLPAKDYQALSLREKFTYCMIHAEDFQQNCDIVPPVLEEEKKIFGNLGDAFPEYTWSERQRSFLTKNRDSVMAIIKESVSRSKRMGINYKTAIAEINGWEMVPFIIETFTIEHKDLDLLTLLMKLMKDNKYAPFLKSDTYHKLYGTEEGYYRSFIRFNKANEALMLERANSFYAKMKAG